jgi:hypothetical protein
MPAVLVARHAKEHVERKMHGGAPSPSSTHLVVALFDKQSGARVSDAEVEATVTLLGSTSARKRLKPMAIADQPSFGGILLHGRPRSLPHPFRSETTRCGRRDLCRVRASGGARRTVAMNDAMGSHASLPAAGEAARLAAIVRIAAQKGFAHYAQRLGLSAPSDTDEAVRREGDARALSETLEELGPTFVKFGQMLSQRPDIFPASLVNEVRALQDRATRFPAEAARRIIEEDTGHPVGETFAQFNDEPLAAASMAQVHCATLPNGTRVIVKVQRPGIAQAVEGDIAVLRRLARLLPVAVSSLRALNLPDFVEEFATTLHAELDFVQEGRSGERFAEFNREEREVFVPKVLWETTTTRVLTMEHSQATAWTGPTHRFPAVT